jgi:hypothetical protein
MMFTEARISLDEALIDLYTWYCVSHRIPLTEATVDPDAVIAKFKAMGPLTTDHVTKLRELTHKHDAPPGMLNKFLSPLKKGLDRLSKMTTFPAVDGPIQAVIARINANSEGSPFKEAIKKLLRGFIKLAQKGGWVASLVLLSLGIVQSVLALPFLGTTMVAATIIFGILRVVADLANGKSVTYALGKAVALWGAGLGIAQLLNMVMPVVDAADAATTPESPNVGADADRTDAQVDAPYVGADADRTDATPAAVNMQEPYTTQRGDNLGKIAQAHGVTVADIQAANPDITNPHRIQPGQTLNIPPASPPGTNIWQGFDFNKHPFPGRR